MDKVVLSYKDSCLYQSDISILTSQTEWLNDKIISFYLEYLQYEVFETEEILFLSSEVTQAIKMMGNPQDINAIIFDSLKIEKRNFMIFPVNDNFLNKAGGSHWSLLVFSRPDNTFFHFDSFGSTNKNAATILARIIKGCLKLENEKFEIVDCLQQNNSYDCGIYVLCHVDMVCKVIMKSKSLKGVKKISYKSVLSKRSEILEIVKNLEELYKKNLLV